MFSVGVTIEHKNGKATSMVLQRVQSSLVRLALVTGIAIALLAAMSGITGPTSASAAPVNRTASSNYTCDQAMDIAGGLRQIAQTMENIGNKELANYYQGKADGIADSHYPCGNWGGGKGK